MALCLLGPSIPASPTFLVLSLSPTASTISGLAYGVWNEYLSEMDMMCDCDAPSLARGSC